MEPSDWYYTLDRFLAAGKQAFFEMFIAQCISSFKGCRSIPVIRIPNPNDSNAHFYVTFTADLAKKAVDGERKLQKAVECIVKYGFRGFSRGGKNGIFLQNKENTRMQRKTLTLLREHWQEIQPDLRVFSDLDDFEGFKLVKVVSHDPSGTRVVGAMWGERIVMLGVASY